MSAKSPFGPTPPGESFRRNAVQHGHPFEDNTYIGMGFVDAADALVQHWMEHGPNDLLFLPIIWNYRHGIELLLKAAIQEAARCLRRNGDPDPKVVKEAVDSWLSRKAGHSLEALMNRLDEWLTRLTLENLPADTKATINSLHLLDPGGDTFRYASSWDNQAKRFVPAKRPAAPHIDVVAMGQVFRETATMIGGGVLAILDEHREYQQSMMDQ